MELPVEQVLEIQRWKREKSHFVGPELLARNLALEQVPRMVSERKFGYQKAGQYSCVRRNRQGRHRLLPSKNIFQRPTGGYL